MANRPAIIRQRDITNALRGAEKAGFAYQIVMRPGEAILVPVRLSDVPTIPAVVPTDEESVDAPPKGYL